MNLVRPDLFETTPCPLCGAREAAACETGADYLFGSPGEFQYVRCRACRHVYLNPRPKLECLAHFYPVDYAPHQTQPAPAEQAAAGQTGSTGRQPWYLSPWVRRLPGLRSLYYWLAEIRSEYAPPIENRSPRGLELGCAVGQFLVRMRERGWQMHGIEFAPEPARRAAQLGFQVHVGTLKSARLPDASFDAVFAWMVIEHLHDPVQTLQEIRRVLKPRGWLAFSVPNYACFERRLFGRYWFPLMPPVHLQQFTPESLRQLLERSGFDLVRIQHQFNVLNLVGSLGILLREKTPARRWGQKLIDYTNHPSTWFQFAAATAARLLAAARQGGRLTIIARARTDA